jgi:hypothetical protein
MSRKHCKSLGKIYRKKASNGRKASCMKKSRKSRGKKSGRKSAKRSGRKSKKCPKGQVGSFRKLANGKMGKKVCVPKPFGAVKSAPAPAQEEAGDYEFNLPALGYRIKKRSAKRSGRKSRRHSRRH